MLDLGPHKIDGKVSLKSLDDLRAEMLEKRLELQKKLIQIIDDPEEKEEAEKLGVLKDQINLTLEDIDNCFILYEKYGNISKNKVIDDREIFE